MNQQTPGRDHAVIPVKGLRLGKSRLTSLDCETRYRLNRVQFIQTAKAVKEAFGAHCTTVTSSCPEVRELALAEGLHFLPEREPGDLNAALSRCRVRLRMLGARSMTVVPVDLVQISAASLCELLARSGGEAFIVPDRALAGTNLFHFPLSAQFALRYGEESFSEHVLGLLRCGLKPHVYAASPLNEDLDLPPQLAGLASWLDALFDVSGTAAQVGHGVQPA